MCLYFALMYKTLGGYNWSDLFHPVLQNETIALAPAAPIVDDPYTEPFGEPFGDPFNEPATNFEEENILATASDLQTSIQGLKAVSLTVTCLHIDLVSHNHTIRFSDIHNGSLSRPFRLCHVVDVFRVVRRFIIRNVIPIVLHQSVNHNS